jgi:WD40 repeat protein
MPRRNCPSDQALLAFHLGTAPPDALEEVAEHLEGCPRCEAALQKLDDSTDPVLAGLRRPVPAGRPTGTGGELPARDGVDLTAREHWPNLPGYEVLDALGRGGMGVVYKARDLRLGRLVALKRLRSQTGQELARSRTEAETLAQLQHPNIVQIHELVEHEGQAYLTLELVGGGSLSGHLTGKPQPPRAAAELIETLARAVHHAHQRGIVHRDLKPANILLEPVVRSPSSVARTTDYGLRTTGYGLPKITDFGIAKRLSVDSGATHVGDVLGTPTYMSPEQASGQVHGMGPATDIYSLGVILYELLTGRVPLQGPTTLDTLVRVRTEEPVPPRRLQPSVPRDLETICLKCLAKEPHRRYASALGLANDLRHFLASEPIVARPPSALYRCGKFAQRNRVLVGGVAGVGIALILGMLGTSAFALREADQRRRANAEREAALREAYYARLAAAGAALRDHDVAAAASHLEVAPEALRDWEWRHLHSRLDESAAVARAPDQGSIRLASCPEGIRVVTAGPLGLRLTDSDGREHLALPLPHGHAVFHVEDTRRGTRLFLRKEGSSLAVLDETGEVQLRLSRPAGWFHALAVSPDQTQIVLAWIIDDPPCSFGLYDLASGEKRAVFHGHADHVHGLAFSPDGQRVASAGEDRTVRLWDAATGAPTAVRRGHTDKVYDVAFSPQGDRIVTTSADGTVRQWDAATGLPVAVPYRGHNHEVRTALYSPDGRWLASGGSDRTVRLWAAADGEERVVLHGHTGTVMQYAFSPDGQRLASAAEDGTVRLWDVGARPNPCLLAGHTSYVYPVAYSPDGQWIASGGWDQTVRLWEAATGEPVAAFRDHPDAVKALAFSPDGARLVVGCHRDGLIQVWDVATAQRQASWRGPPVSIEALAVSADGTRITSATLDGEVRVWEAATGRELARWGSPEQTFSGLAYSPDGRLLAGGCKDHGVYLWDAHTHELLAKLPGHTQSVFGVAFSRDSRRLASASLDRTVRLWDAASGASLAELRGHTDEVFTAVFHPDGRRIASAGRDRIIRLWDVTTGEEVARLQGHTNYVYSLAFSPDGTTLASGSGDFTVRLWDTAPVARRLQARRDAEAIRAEAEQLVGQLFRELEEPSAVVRALRADPALSAALRREAQRAIWRRLVPPE